MSFHPCPNTRLVLMYSTIVLTIVALKMSVIAEDPVGVTLDHCDVETHHDDKKNQQRKRRRTWSYRIQYCPCCSACQFLVMNG